MKLFLLTTFHTLSVERKQKAPVKKVLMGKELHKVISAGSLRNPAAMNEFVLMAQKRLS